MRRNAHILAAVLAILVLGTWPVVAGGPYTIKFDAGTGSQLVQIVDYSAYSAPQESALYFADAEVTASYWDVATVGATTTWTRMNDGQRFVDGSPVGSPSNAYADSVSTIPAGVVERPDFKFKAIYLTRSSSTSGVLKWFD